MQIEQLEFIVSVAKYQSFSKTAEMLHISQSAISQSIKKLEEEIGLELFVRGRSGAVPTEKGIQIIKQAEEVLREFSGLKQRIVELKNTEKRELKIGLISGLYIPFLPSLLSEIKKEFPDIVITFIEKSSVEITNSIIDKELDIGVVAIYENSLKKKDKLEFEVLRDVKMYAYVNKSSPLSQLHHVPPQQLSNQTFVIFNGEFINWYFEEYIKRNGMIDVLFTSNNNETIRETIRKGLAITIDSEIEIINNPYIQNGEIIPIPLVDTNAVKSCFGFVKIKNKTCSKEVRTFERLFKHYLSEMYKEVVTIQ